jgi:hypothetical protein
MRKKIAPKWVLMEVLDLLHQGVNIYEWEEVRSFLGIQKRFTMLNWIEDNRQLFYFAILSKQYNNVELYYD